MILGRYNGTPCLHLSLHTSIEYVSRFTHTILGLFWTREKGKSLNHKELHKLPIHVIFSSNRIRNWEKQYYIFHFVPKPDFLRERSFDLFLFSYKNKSRVCADSCSSRSPWRADGKLWRTWPYGTIKRHHQTLFWDRPLTPRTERLLESSVCVCVVTKLSSAPFHQLYWSVCRSGALARQ